MQQWHTERQRSGYLITTTFKRSDKCINHQVIQPWRPNTKENFIPGIGVRVREILGIMKKRATAYTKLSYPVNLLTNNSICNWLLLVGVIIFIIRVWVTCIVSWNLREVRKRKCLTPKMWKPFKWDKLKQTLLMNTWTFHANPQSWRPEPWCPIHPLFSLYKRQYKEIRESTIRV